MGKKGRYTKKRKKTKKKNNRFILFLFIIIIVTVCFIITKRENENLAVTTSASIGEIIDIIEEGQANVNRYIVYGTHLNVEGALTITPGDIENVQLVAKKSSGEEVEIKTTYEYENGNITFTTLDKINLGLDLESLDNENYYILLKITYPNEEVKYYSLENDSEYTKPIEYYTLTRNNTNNKIKIEFLTQNSVSALVLNINKVSKLPDYDIYNIYDEEGRVTMANKSGAKILVSLHLNSNEFDLTYGGVEVYAAPNLDLSLAKSFADNIVEKGNATYSKMENFKKENGVYVSTIEIGNKNSGTFKGYKGIYDEAAYLFIIREIGGIATGAYVNGSSPSYGENIYRNSNVGVEGYLIELGYMNVNKDIRNIKNNKESYMQAIADSINSFYKIKE